MKLSDGEKIIIAVLADLHKALKVKGDIDVDRLMASVHGGHLWSLDWDLPGLLHGSEPTEEVVKQTCDILDAWDFIEMSFAALDKAGKDAVRKVNFDHDPKFSGFDGNNEDHYGVARHLIDDMDRYQHFKGRDINSHSQQLDSNLRISAAFEGIKKTLGHRHPMHLNADELVSMFNAAYPNRQVA